jgi:AcrR family transcriptional regulator
MTLPGSERSASGRMPGDQRKQQILEAARRAFSRRGDVAGTTIRDIAAEAGISEGIIYRHFESKEDLFFEAAVRPLHEAFALGEEKMAALVPELPGADRHKLAVAYYREMIEMLADLIPLLGLVLFGDPKHADPFYRDHLMPALDELGDQWAEAYGRLTGKAQPTSRTATLVHFGVALMFALDQRRSANPPDVDAIAEELAREGYVPMARDVESKPKGRRRNG